MIYARNDVCSVNVSAAMGGCGTPHVRPDGETLWGLSCASCEAFLRTDQNWSSRPEDVPESFDETAHREASEKNIGRRQVAALDAAAGMLALLAGPRDILAGALGGQLGALPAAGPPCRKCEGSVLPNSRFCGHCGAPVLREVEGAA